MKSIPTPFDFDEGQVYPMHPCCHTGENREASCPECLERYRRDGIEVLPAFRTRDGLWSVWCRYCKEWHTHSPEFGHRVAHCHDLFVHRKWISAAEHSGYFNKGYALAYSGEWKDRAKLKDAGLKS